MSTKKPPEPPTIDVGNPAVQAAAAAILGALLRGDPAELRRMWLAVGVAGVRWGCNRGEHATPQ